MIILLKKITLDMTLFILDQCEKKQELFLNGKLTMGWMEG